MKTLNLDSVVHRRLLVAALALAGLALAPVLGAAAPAVSVSDQLARDGTVTIASVSSTGPGWLVVHADNAGAPGPVLGWAAVPDGVTRDLIVKIDQARATPVVQAMLHLDAGAVGTYEFPGPDKPVMVDGRMVSPAFSAVGLGTARVAPVADGVVNPGEYGYTKEYPQLTVSASRTADTLFLAVAGRTSGWVAVGTGSARMDGATIFIGFVDRDGRVQMKPQKGQGYSHVDAAQAVTATVAGSAMRESDGQTTLELALESASYLAAGQDALQLILAVGPEDSFSPRHTFRTALAVPLAK